MHFGVTEIKEFSPLWSTFLAIHFNLSNPRGPQPSFRRAQITYRMGKKESEIIESLKSIHYNPEGFEAFSTRPQHTECVHSRRSEPFLFN